MSFQILSEKGRTVDFSISLYENDGTTSVTLAATDVVRFKMGRRDGVKPDLDLLSGVVTANGSTVTIDETGTSPVASVTVRMAQADTSGLIAGMYDAEVLVVDDSETAPANAIKHFERGTVSMQESLGGSIGLT